MIIFLLTLTLFFSNINASSIEIVKEDTLLDKSSSLNWSPEIDMKTWKSAKNFCQKLEHNGYKDWRLPTLSELKSALCKTNYKEGFDCNNLKKGGLIEYRGKENTTYWSSNKTGNKAYYIVLNSSAIYSKASITNSSNARCVRGVIKKEEIEEDYSSNTYDNRNFKYYITPQITAGAMISNTLSIDNRMYLGGAIDFGYMARHDLAVKLSVEGGFNIQDLDYPLLLSAVVGPEYFFTDRISGYLGVGVGLLRGDTNNIVTIGSSLLTENYFALSWKVGGTFKVYKGKSFSMPIGLYYAGLLPTQRTELTIHLINASIGFMFYL
jgi:opacity protein-like surface antigen